MKKRPQKGAIAWIPLSDFADGYNGELVGIKYVGPKMAKQWQNLAHKTQFEESKRVAETRKPFTPTQAPEMWESNFMTPDGLVAYEDMIWAIIAEAVGGLRHAPDWGTSDEEALALVEHLDTPAQAGLMRRAQELQRLATDEFFRSEDPGDLEPKGSDST